MEPRLPVPPPPATWGPLEAIPVFMLALLIAAIAAVPASAAGSCGIRNAVFAFGAEAGFLVSVVLWVRLVSRSPLAALGAPRRPLGDTVFGVLGGVGLTIAGVVSAALVYWVATLLLGHRPAEPEQVEACVRGTSLALMGVTVVVLAPLAEETFFRGFLYKALRGRLTLWASVLISSIAFAAVHFHPILIAALLPIGAGLALLYELRQSLLTVAVAHGVFNLVGFIAILADRSS